MKFTSIFSHGSISLIFLVAMVEAQSSPNTDDNQRPYARFSPSIAVIVVVLMASLFFMVFFSIYIRHCNDSSGSGTAGRVLSLRSRRAAAARGLDRSVIDTFPTFSYSEVKEHHIGKGVLECAVCLNEFEDDETLRLLPKCDHVFHPDCIDAWLESHVTCPVCRANLVQETESDNITATEDVEEREAETVIQVAATDQTEYPIRPPRSCSVRKPTVLGFGRFRSHSTGHSLVQPGQNLDRFTLRLPAQVRKEVMDRAALNRSRSLAIGLPTEGSSRRGNRTGGGEGSSRGGRLDRWALFARGLSMRSPKVVAEGSEDSRSKRSGSRTPVKMPSFNCLEPKTNKKDDSEASPV